MIRAPWTTEQVDALNATQQRGWRHAFTCASGDRMDEAHRIAQMLVGGDHGQLFATTDGWVCLACDYRQGWAHAEMAEPQVNPLPAFFSPQPETTTTSHDHTKGGA